MASQLHLVPHAVVEAVCSRAEPSVQMRKPPVEEIDLRAGEGIRGDVHAGRGDRQVTVLPAEVLDALQAEGFEVATGDLGENLVIRGLSPEAYRPGAVLVMEGGAALAVTQVRTPCRELDDIAPGLLKATVRRCGYFARVIEGGPLRAGASVTAPSTDRMPVSR